MDVNNSTLNLNITESITTNSTAPFLQLNKFVVVSVSLLNVLVGLPTHSYVIWLMATSESGMALEIFSLNLSICEIGICLFCFFRTMTLWFSGLHGFASFLLGLTVSGRPLFKSVICVERYLAVIHPVTFLKYKPLRYRLMCCTAAWIICFCYCLSCMFLINLHELAIYTWLLSVQGIVFFFIQLFCCVAVLRALKQSGPGERGREREEENTMKRRAFNIILINTVNMAITYVPFVISGIYSIITQQFSENPPLFNLVCFILSGYVRPVFYLHRVGKLRCFCSS